MDSESQYINRHFAAVVSIGIVFACLSILLYIALALISVDLGGPLTCIAAPFVNCISGALFFPISVPLERWLLEKLDWKRTRLYLTVAVTLFGIGLGLILLGTLLLGTSFYDGNWRDAFLFIMFYGGIPLLLGGSLYWLILYIYK